MFLTNCNINTNWSAFLIFLINNSINYTQEGTITIRVNERSNEILVEVMDTGIGIPAEDLPRLFEDFFRASNVEIKGTGLGLSIARRIMEAHNGRIWAESPCLENGLGTKFCIVLPKLTRTRRKPRR